MLLQPSQERKSRTPSRTQNQLVAQNVNKGATICIGYSYATTECYHDSDPLVGRAVSDTTRHGGVLGSEAFGNTPQGHRFYRPVLQPYTQTGVFI